MFTSTQRKLQVNIGTIGHVGHGKTTLTAAITKVLAEEGKGQAVNYYDINKPSIEKARGITFSMTHVEYETDKRQYVHVDCPTHADYVKNMIAGATCMDVGIVVVSATDGCMVETKEQVLLALMVGVPWLVCFINKVDMMDDVDKLELVEMEIREFLTFHGFAGDEIPIIRGSALAALLGRETGKKAILKLLNIVDELPDPVRVVDKAFLMPIEGVLSIKGRGTIATGRIEQGTIKVGEEVEILGYNQMPLSDVIVTGVEMFKQTLHIGEAGHDVELMLKGVQTEDIKRGMVIAKPGSCKIYDMFEAKIYVLTKEERGRETCLFWSFNRQFYIRTRYFTGSLDLPENQMVTSGCIANAIIELSSLVAIAPGTKFDMREKGKTVGLGVVTRVLYRPASFGIF